MSMESSGSGQQSDSKIGCARLVVFFASRECLLWGPGAVTRPISASQAIPIDRTRNSLGAVRDNSANAIASRTTRTKSPRRPDLNHTFIHIPEKDLWQMWRIARGASNNVIEK